MSIITGDGPDKELPSWLRRKGSGRFDVSPEDFAHEVYGPLGDIQRPALMPRKGLFEFARNFSRDLYGRGLLTSEQSEDMAQELAKALAYLPAEQPQLKTNMPNVVLYRGADGTLFAVDPSLPLPGEDEEDGMSERVPWPEGGNPNKVDLNYEISEEGRAMGFGPRMKAATIGPIGHVSNPAEEAALKPGWKTTEGATTILVGWVLFIATAANWTSHEGTQDALTRLTIFLNNIGPMMIYLPVLWHFITSRGKVKSNALRAGADSRAMSFMQMPGTLASEERGLTDEQITRGFEAVNDKIAALGIDLTRRSKEMGLNADNLDRELAHINEFFDDLVAATLALANFAGYKTPPQAMGLKGRDALRAMVGKLPDWPLNPAKESRGDAGGQS